MLPHREHKRVIDAQPSVLGLADVEIVAEGMRSRVADHKVVGRVVASMEEGNGERKRVGDVAGGVHEALFAGVDFEGGAAFVGGEDRFDREALGCGAGMVG